MMFACWVCYRNRDIMGLHSFAVALTLATALSAVCSSAQALPVVDLGVSVTQASLDVSAANHLPAEFQLN